MEMSTSLQNGARRYAEDVSEDGKREGMWKVKGCWKEIIPLVLIYK